MSTATVLQMVWGQVETRPAYAPPETETAAGPVMGRVIDGDLPFYRKYTEALLRRYLKMSMEAGRVPSMLGREMFRGKVTSYKVHSFEDVVIFVCDVEKCLKALEPWQQRLITRVTLQEYTLGEAAAMLELNPRTAVRRYNQSLNRMTELFLQRKLLEPLLASDCREGCQPG